MSLQRGPSRPDPDAYTRLTRDAQGRLFQLALALCGDADLAADLAQEALVRGYLSFDRFKPGAPVFPWLARILKNLWIDHLRSARVRREVTAEARAEPATAEPDPLDRVLAGERARSLYAAIAALPPELALVITLVDLQGLSYQDAASVMDSPVGTVRSRLSRARERLRQALSD